MKHDDAIHSKRYYLFRHVPKSEEDTVKFRTSNGEWSTDFDRAQLWADHEFLVKKGEELAAIENRHGQRHNYCIGQVNIEVNGFFVIEVVGK